jgi:putative protease
MPSAPRLPEILAPAGDAESLAAALSAGAEAVYFGLDEGLNARARATNFSVERLPELCAQIHRAGARAYVTLNTLVFEHELATLEALVKACAESGVDAIIVQDPAVALIARALAPTLEVHASTQMTISSPEGAAFAQRLGITRVVVPRELSVEEIRTFAKGTPLELEVFIHGALCMSWSGQCLTSEAWGGRSANRGQCAQSCRLPYQLVVDGQVRALEDVAYLLSPLDLAGARAVSELAAIGVASLKIEGRLKGPAYVTTAVEGYRRWREAIAEKRDTTAQAQAQLQADLGKMAVSYSRGFSDGFLAGSDHQDLVEGRFPKHRGALLGEVVEVRGGEVLVRRAERRPSGGVGTPEGYRPEGAVKVALPVIGGASAEDARGVPMEVPEPVPGCGVGFDTGRPQDEEPGGPIFGVEPVRDGWRLKFGRPGPDLGRVKPGHRVWLSSDPRLTSEANAAVEDGTRGVSGRIPVVLTVAGRAGEPLEVTFAVEAPRSARTPSPLSVSANSDLALAPAKGGGLDVTLLSDKLGALGGTPFRLAEARLEGLSPGLHLPVSALKALRRPMIEALERKLVEAARHAVVEGSATERVQAEARTLGQSSAFDAARSERGVLIPLVRTAPQLEAVIASGLREVELDWMELVGLEKAVRRAREAGLSVTIATTRVQKPGEEGVDSRLARLAPDGILVRHWGGLMQFSKAGASRPRVHGDFSLNVTNSVTALHLLALSCDSITAAHDLDETQLHAMLANIPAERLTVAVHHHIATFHTEHCVYAHTLSHGRDFRTCGRPCETHQVALEDREGRRHPVVVDVGCRNTVFNAQAQSAAKAVPALLSKGVRRFRAEFVWEDEKTTASVLSAWRALLDGTLTPAELLKRIEGHEQFGVTAGTMQTFDAPRRLGGPQHERR